MKIGNIQIVHENNSLIIGKSKLSKNFEIVIFFVAGFAVFMIPLVAVLNVKGQQWWRNFNVILILSVLLLISLALVIYNFKRTHIKYKSFILEKVNDQIRINGELICNATKLHEVKIKKIIEGEGGTSYNVGLSLQDQFYPISLDQNKEEAISIANIVAGYLDAKIKIERGQMILP